MRIVQLVNQPRDIPLALLLERTCPHPIRTVISNVDIKKDEFGWAKPKALERCLTGNDTANAKRLLKNVVECTNLAQLKDEMRKADVCISRGREFFVFDSPAKKNIALCFNRCYFGRFLDVLPRYAGRLKVMHFGAAWMSREYCGQFEMNNHNKPGRKHDYDYAYSFKPHYLYGNPFDYFQQYLKKRGKAQVRKDLGLPADRPIAFLSFRKSEKAFSIYDSVEEFMGETIKMLKQFKDDGYYIISRRRMGRHDKVYCKQFGHPDFSRYSEVEPYIDVEMNDTTRFPGEIWEGLYASDVHLLSDTSGIAYIEAALMRCPVYQPHKNVLRNEGIMCPAVRNMFRTGLIMNEFGLDKVQWWRKEIENFISRWYTGDINHFWREVFK